jgi:hypothetical protein
VGIWRIMIVWIEIDTWIIKKMALRDQKEWMR